MSIFQSPCKGPEPLGPRIDCERNETLSLGQTEYGPSGKIRGVDAGSSPSASSLSGNQGRQGCEGSGSGEGKVSAEALIRAALETADQARDLLAKSKPMFQVPFFFLISSISAKAAELLRDGHANKDYLFVVARNPMSQSERADLDTTNEEVLVYKSRLLEYTPRPRQNQGMF